MDMFSQILDSFGIKDYDQLNSMEQETLRSWVDKVEKSQITLEDMKRGIVIIRESLEAELVQNDNRKKDIYLKARLKNAILFESILTRPERARAALDSYIARGKTK
jgi:hypothetical protein